MEAVIIKDFPTYRIYPNGMVESFSGGTGRSGKDWAWREIKHGTTQSGGARTKKRKYPCVILRRGEERKVYIRLIHRLIWEAFKGPIPLGMQIDHINHDTFDFSLPNLRLSTHAENQRNREFPESKTGYRGVKKRKGGRYEAHITLNNKYIYLGCYDTAEEASRARDKKALEIHGEFAKLNFIRQD